MESGPRNQAAGWFPMRVPQNSPVINCRDQMCPLKRQLNAAAGLLVVSAVLTPAYQAALSDHKIATQWTGPPAVVETTAQIMARDAERRAVERTHPGTFRKARLPVHHLPDRRHLSQNPDSPHDVSRTSRNPMAVPLENRERGVPASPQTVGLSFDTFDSDPSEGPFPPEPAGAIGPTQFLMANNSVIESFDKGTGQPDGQIHVALDSFFASVSNGFTAVEPHLRYDRFSGDWFVTAINTGVPNRLLIAVSNGASITSATTWAFYYYDVSTNVPSAASCFVDNPSLGVDVNALYIGADQFCVSGSQYEYSGAGLFVVYRNSVVSGGLIVVNTTYQQTGPVTPQGVDNDDPNATLGYFIGVSSQFFGGLVADAVVFNSNGSFVTPSSLTVPATDFPVAVPHLGNANGTTGELDGIDDRLTMAHIRNGYLWTAHAIGVDFTGTSNNTRPDRNGLRWYQLGAPASSAEPFSLVQAGTVFDPTSTSPRNYWVPSLVVSGQGNVVLASSTAGLSHYIDAVFTARRSNDPSGQMDAPSFYTSSNTAYNPPGDTGSSFGARLWGVSSSTSLDPSDDMTMWTIQQYGSRTNAYGLQVAKVLAPPPVPSSSTPSVAPGQAAAEITVTGTGFYDPGPAFPNRLSVHISGGVTVNNLTYVNPTTLILSISTTSATLGAQDVTVTNPDGQSGKGTGILQVSNSGCAFSIAPTSHPFSAPSGTGSVVVTAGTGCPWTASSNSSFVSVTSGASGSGNGTVNYSVAANPTSIARTGTLAIAGSVFTVNQAGLIATSVSLNASANPIGFGQPLTLTATVSPSTATGTITFAAGAQTLGTVTLSGGQATLTPVLPISVVSLQANYSGDVNDAASSSAALSLTVAAPLNWPSPPTSLLTGSPGAVGDFNGDGKADLAMVQNNVQGVSSLSLLLGNGDGTFVTKNGPVIGGAPAQMLAVDLNKDGKVDLAINNQSPDLIAGELGSVTVLLGNGDGTFGAAANYQTIRNLNCIAAGDFTGDGNVDLVVGGFNDAAFLPGRGDGTFPSATILGVLGDTYSFAVADFKLNDKLDLAVGVLGDYENGNGLVPGPNYYSMWFNTGNTTILNQLFTGFQQLSPGGYTVTGDFNGDGKPDLAISNSTGVSVLLGKGDGTFQPGVFYATGTGTAFSTRMAVADFNGDGKPDLAVLNDNANTVSILPGNGDGTFQSPITYGVAGLAAQFGLFNLLLGDFNGDGRPDLVVTNSNSTNFAILLSTSPRLAVASSHTGNFQQGQAGQSYSINVANSGTASSVGTVTVTDTLPSGLIATAIAGSGWTCTLGPLACFRSDALAPTNSYPAIMVTVSVADNAPASVTNAVTVSSGGKLNSSTDITTINATSLVYASPASAMPGNTAQIPLTLALPVGLSLDSLSFTLSLTPVSGAAALSGTLAFVPRVSQPAPVSSNAGAAMITLTYAGLNPAFSGTVQLGTVTVTVPAGALLGQLYTTHVSVASASLSGNTVTVIAGLDTNLVVGVPYLVGDVFPATTDGDGHFGDGTLNTLDLIALLRAVTQLSGFVPATCSDRYDAMDAFPVDSASARGGDGVLNTLDLITLLKRVTNLDPLRPTRVPRGLACTSAAPQSRGAPMPGQPEASLELVGDDGGTAVYLSSRDQLSLSGFAFSLTGRTGSPLRLTPGNHPASLIDTGTGNSAAMAWLDGVVIGSGQRILLTRVEGTSPADLRFTGASANELESGRDVAINLRNR